MQSEADETPGKHWRSIGRDNPELTQSSQLAWPLPGDDSFPSSRTLGAEVELDSRSPSSSRPRRAGDSRASSARSEARSDVTFSPQPLTFHDRDSAVEPESEADEDIQRAAETEKAWRELIPRELSPKPSATSPRRPTEEEFEKAMYWASLPDAALQSLAEKTLRGEVASRLLRRLCRQDIVGLLSTYKKLAAEPPPLALQGGTMRPKRGSGRGSALPAMERAPRASTGSLRPRSRSASRTSTPQGTGFGTQGDNENRSLSPDHASSTWSGGRSPRQTAILLPQQLKELAQVPDVLGAAATAADVRPDSPRVTHVRRWLSNVDP